jgi:hypothetical protein
MNLDLPLLDAIIEGREWSWSVIGIAALIFGLFLRSLLITDILKRIKTSNRKWYRRTQAYYLGRALLGWFFFMIFVVGLMCLWRFEEFFLKHLNLAQWMIIFSGSLGLSLFLQLRAYTRSIVDAVQEYVVSDKGL